MKKSNIVLIALTALSIVLVGCGDKGPKEPTAKYAFFNCQYHVEKRLKSPSSADFGSLSNSNIIKLKTTRRGGKNEIKYLVTGSVAAKNSFNVQIRNNYACEITGITGDKWVLNDISIR